MDNLRRFNTEADYSAATLNYPAVSYVVSGDTVHYDKSAPAPAPAIQILMIPDNGSDAGRDIVLYNCGATGITDYVSDITMEGTSIQGWSTSCTANTGQYNNPLIAYTLAEGNQSVNGWFGGSLGDDEYGLGEVLIPSDITEINDLPNGIQRLVVLATTPPSVAISGSDWEEIAGSVYVPDDSLSTYRSALNWISANLYPLSEYVGNLPIN